MDIQDMKSKIQAILEETLPESFHKEATIQRSPHSRNIKIMLSPSNVLINGIPNQYPQVVSLCLWYWLDGQIELKPQGFGGCGGNSFSRLAKEGEPEHYYHSVKIPFRAPQPNDKAIIRAIERFCLKYVQVLKENANYLMHKDKGDYSFLEEKYVL